MSERSAAGCNRNAVPDGAGPDLQPETVTFLEMLNCDEFKPARRDRGPLEMRRIDPGDYLEGRAFYMKIGADWLWIDRLVWSEEAWRDYYRRPGIELWAGYVNDAPVGFFELASDGQGSTELAYFGLLPAFIGRGLGGQLLNAAIERAWQAGARRVWVHTSSRDHAHALGNYLARGFRIYKTETHLAPTRFTGMP